MTKLNLALCQMNVIDNKLENLKKASSRQKKLILLFCLKCLTVPIPMINSLNIAKMKMTVRH